MSGNPKQTAAGGQQMRYSTYHPLQQQSLPPRDTFLANQNYVQQQPNQASTQGVGLRGIAQSGPPNQAPTPPNQDLKAQAVPQQQSIIYQQPNTVRSSQQFYNRPPGPQSQGARMGSNPQRIYQNTPHQYMPVPQMPSYINLNPMGYFNAQQRQNFVQPQVALLQSHNYPTAYQAFTPPQISQTPQTVAYPYFQIRPGPPPQPASTPSNPNQPSITTTIPLQQPVLPQQSLPRQPKRRPNAVPIIDPTTGVDKLDEIYVPNNSHPPSGESSARQTPQPAPHIPNKEVQAPFAKPMTYMTTNDGEMFEVEFDCVPSPSQATEETQDFHDHPYSLMPVAQPPPVNRSNAKYDHIAQTSTLKAHAKEFVLPSAKEPPVVSANCDSVEVTLNKLQKGRESPVKGRKAKEHNKESTKETTPHPPKETHQPEKQQVPVPVVKEEPAEVPATKVKETIPPHNNNQHSTKVTEKENDKRKKDTKSDTKQVTESSTNDNAKQANQEHEAAAPVAKSKQNSNQKKDNHKTNNQRPTNPPNVPAPQPAKSNSKTIKKNELNSKGASKEGNEMDVFQIADTVNANVPPPPTTVTTNNAATNNVTNNNDVLNANAPVTNNVAPVVAENDATTNDVAAKVEESNNVAPAPVPANPAHEVKTTKKPWDVTDVFKGRLPEPSPYVPSSVTENKQDETDRAVVTNDRPAQAANEAAAAAPVAEKKPELPYKDGQWAPFNQEGNKKYDREFLLAVRNLPIARVKPANLPDSLEYSEGARQRGPDNRDNRYSNSMMGKDFTPPFLNSYGGKNSSMKGSSITKHPSLSGKMANKGGKSINGGNKISISLREDIKLRETENAWKPGRLAKAGSDSKSDDEKKSEELYKKVRGVLNKLTPEKFKTLLSQIKALKIDTIERLQGVINLVFEKAIDEPSFAVAYAKMCMEVGLMQVTKTTADGKEEGVNFRKLLITRCQEEFEKQSRDESKTEEKLKEIENCQDAEKKKELEEELDEYQRKIRIRSVGNVTFIGELFKINMLTANIMTVCINCLIQHRDEESLECLCKLLTTIGRKLEESRDIQNYFDQMQKIVDEKQVSSRIWFMIQDVIDLRKNKWVSRRQNAGPKTIDQIARDVATEQLNSHLDAMPSTPRKDERDMGAKSKMRNSNDEWNNRSQRQAPFTLNKDKLKIVKQPPSEDETFGKSSMFKMWNKGASYKAPVPFSVTDTSNRFSLLDNNFGESDRKMSGGSNNGGGRYKDSAYNSKGSSLERSSYSKQSYDSRGGSRSGSQHRMNEGAGPSGHSRASSSSSGAASLPMAPPPAAVAKPPSPPPVAAQPVAAAAPVAAPVLPKMTEDQLKRFCKNCCDEYTNDNCTFEEAETEFRTTIPISYMPTLVSDSILDVLETSKTPRRKLGLLLGKLLRCGTVPLQEFSLGLEDIFSQVEDLIIDIPTIWTCLAEILEQPILEGGLTLGALHKCSKLVIANGMGHRMLPPLFKLIICEKGPNYLKELMQSSNLSLTDFMPQNLAETCIEENQLEFLTGGAPAQGNSQLNYEQIEQKLMEFFESNTPFDDICMWITANVGKRVEENSFIRTLATAIYKFSIVRTKLNQERLSRHSKLFNKYVDNNPTYELQCLYALQSLVNQLEHPQGLLLSIFNKLSEDSIFAQESFLSWENSKDLAEQEGKGVALKQLTSFFTQLKENDDEDYGSTGSEEA